MEAAWAAARTKGWLFQRRFHRWMNRLGKVKADVALAAQSEQSLAQASALAKTRQQIFS